MGSKDDNIQIGVNNLKSDVFNHPKLTQMREDNLRGMWREGCVQCKYSEAAIGKSFRTDSNLRFGRDNKKNGLVNLYLMIDNACNLACRICGPNSSTKWQDILYKSGDLIAKKHARYDHYLITSFFDGLDLSGLENVMITGGETLLGSSSKQFVEYLCSRGHIDNIQINFQTNGTLIPDERFLDLLSGFKLVKFSISLDGTKDRFEYLRWPAKWDRQVDTLNRFREKVPPNVMFTVEQTLNPFNLIYKDEIISFVENEFSDNRLGDKTDYNQHIAAGTYDLRNITDEYVRYLIDNGMERFVPGDHREDPEKIREMLDFTSRHDVMRQQDWKSVFPDVVPLYSRYL